MSRVPIYGEQGTGSGNAMGSGRPGEVERGKIVSYHTVNGQLLQLFLLSARISRRIPMLRIGLPYFSLKDTFLLSFALCVQFNIGRHGMVWYYCTTDSKREKTTLF